jgi:shikimate dehydrogenase
VSKLQIKGSTPVFALLGNPVSHSLSPNIYNAALRATDLEAVYVAVACESEAVPSIMRSLAGGNITVPHKGVAAVSLEKSTDRVARTRACNTFWKQGKRLCGDNTDVIGFSVALRRLLPDPAGARVLIVGAGGAARAAVYALLDTGADEINVIARSRARRKEMEAVAGRHVGRVHVVGSEKAVLGEGFDLLVNATPLGLKTTDKAPFKFEKLGGLRAVFDMVYRRGGTAWVQRANAMGIPAVDGTEMLLQQAAAAFEIWWDVDAPVRAMRAAIEAPE